jgi:hypothetical protein
MNPLKKLGLVAVTLGIIVSGSYSRHYSNKAQESAREVGLASALKFTKEQKRIHSRIKELEKDRRELYRNQELREEYEEKKQRYCILGQKEEEVQSYMNRWSRGYLSANLFLISLFRMFAKKRRQ